MKLFLNVFQCVYFLRKHPEMDVKQSANLLLFQCFLFKFYFNVKAPSLELLQMRPLSGSGEYCWSAGLV